MDLRACRDNELLSQIKAYVQSERDVLVKILHHLREIERRRLFCDLGYRSLFDYAVSELRYSEGQASRRIQAMRLIKDIPEVEAKIATGELSLSNVHQASKIKSPHVFMRLEKCSPSWRRNSGLWRNQTIFLKYSLHGFLVDRNSKQTKLLGYSQSSPRPILAFHIENQVYEVLSNRRSTFTLRQPDVP